jgi:hypothetical protein
MGLADKVRRARRARSAAAARHRFNLESPRLAGGSEQVGTLKKSHLTAEAAEIAEKNVAFLCALGVLCGKALFFTRY